MNKVHVISASIIIILLASVSVYYSRSCNVIKNINTEGNNQKQEVSITEVSKNQSTKYAKINISYPKVIGIDDKFNSRVEDYINITLDEFNINAEDNWKARIATSNNGDVVDEFPKDNEKFEFFVGWELAQISKEKISFLITIYQFSGGAHGFTVLKAFNYDVVNNKEIILGDLFVNDPDYLSRISSYSILNLKGQLENNESEGDYSIEEGAGPKLENFEIFTISKNKLTFYFPHNSIGPYVLGIKTVDMYNWNKNINSN